MEKREREKNSGAGTRHRAHCERPLIPTLAGFPQEIGRETKESSGVSEKDKYTARLDRVRRR